jgi:hypothetical protein
MQEKKALKKNPDMVTRVIDNETILLPLYKSSDEINCIYSLNKAASAVWNLIDGKTTLSDIKKKVLAKFDATPEEAGKKMQELLKDLKAIKAVV